MISGSSITYQINAQAEKGHVDINEIADVSAIGKK
jgi:hypothetical protein